jgi:Cys-rich four helix bundle protein (predicted Tat secretion target)
MNRRDFIAAAALALPAFAATNAFAADDDMPAKNGTLDEVVAAAEHCLKTARACRHHCLEMLGRGDTSLKECNDTVNNMLVACEAMVEIGGYRSASDADLKLMAKACGSFCRSCEAQCSKHAAKHKVCADCLADCIACAKACEAYA